MSAIVGLLTLAVLTDAPQLKVASPSFGGVNLNEKETAFFSEHLAQQLATGGAKVISDQDISAVLGLERRRQLTGCAETSNECLAELAGALGVDALVTGSVAKLKQRYQLNVKLIAASNGSLIASESLRADSDEQVVDLLNAMAPRLLKLGAEALHRSLGLGNSSSASSGRGLPVLSIALAGVTVVASGFGTFAAVRANSDYGQLLVAPDEPTALRLRDDGVAWRTATQLGYGVGGLALIGAVATFVAAGGTQGLAVWVSPRATGFALTWNTP